jgi:hypothetical protein
MNGTALYLRLPWLAACALALLVVFGCASPAHAQTVPLSDRITWLAPLEKAADLLQQRFGTVVTYEDPVWVWRGELAVVGSDENLPGGLRVTPHTLLLPGGLTPEAGAVLNAQLLGKVLDAYHQQNPERAEFQVLESKMGLHIVPLRAHDESGALKPAGSLLDAKVSIPVASRTASEHVAALCRAVSAGSTVPLEYSDSWFNQYFAANGYVLPRTLTGSERPYMVFEWGAKEMTARDALIDLMSRSATSMMWRVKCISSAQAKNRSCQLGLGPLMVNTALGSKARYLDRCAKCVPVPRQ